MCDFCTAAAIWLLEAESPDGQGMTSLACQRDVDIARAVMARIGPPTITPLDPTSIPEG